MGSLGALSGAIEEFGGGVVMITHNNEFCSKLCPETWLLQGGRLDCQGDAAWMENVMKEKVEDQNKLTEMVDGLGNTIKLKNKDKKMSRKEIKAMSKQRKAAPTSGRTSQTTRTGTAPPTSVPRTRSDAVQRGPGAARALTRGPLLRLASHCIISTAHF